MEWHEGAEAQEGRRLNGNLRLEMDSGMEREQRQWTAHKHAHEKGDMTWKRTMDMLEQRELEVTMDNSEVNMKHENKAEMQREVKWKTDVKMD